MSFSLLGRPARRARTLFGLVGCSAATALVIAACIPDLDTSTPPQPSRPAACGDGLIDLAMEQCDPGAQTRPGCTAQCAVFCPGGLVYENHCYFALKSKSSFNDARFECSENDLAHVVTFASEAEWDAVTGFFTSTDPFWIGLNFNPTANGYLAENNEPGWVSARCPGCYAHTDRPDADLPKSPGAAGTTGCVVGAGGASASWLQQSCQGLKTPVNVLCEREPAGTLVDRCNGFFCFTLPHTFPTGKRYVLVPDKVSADDARIGCEQQNGKLVVFESREEREQLWHELQDLVPAPQIWVGLSSMTLGADASVDASLATTTWAWEDTKPADGPGAAYPEPWGVGEPTLAARRAYSLFFPSRVDNQLAHASDVVATASYVCQL